MNEKNICDCGCSGDCGCQPEPPAAGPEANPRGTPMDTQIFKLGLGVLPTSVYIIIAALQADGVRPGLSAIASRWNEKPQALEEALAELEALKIIVRHPGSDGGEAVYLVNPPALWAPNNGE